MTAAVAKKIFVYGGSGALGQSVLKKFNKAGWTTFSADFTPSKSDFAHKFRTLNNAKTKETVMATIDWLKHELQGEKLDCVVHTAGCYICYLYFLFFFYFVVCFAKVEKNCEFAIFFFFGKKKPKF